MKELRASPRLALAALTFAAAGFAQGRAPLVGEVVRQDGAPLANATVTLVEDDADLVGIDPVDVVEVTTDDRGRFVAKTLRGARYTGFAVGPEVDGAAAVCAPVPQLACGGPVTLRATRTDRRCRVVLPNLDTWGDVASLRFRMSWTCCPGHYVDLPISPDGSIDLPPVVATADTELVTTDGALLTRIAVLLGTDPAALMPASDTFAIAVVDERGQAIEGAVVTVQQFEFKRTPFALERIEHRLRPTAETDANGRAQLPCEFFQFAGGSTPTTLVVTAVKQGYEEGAAGWLNGQPFADGEVVAKQDVAPLTITLSKQSEPLEGRASTSLVGKHAWLFTRADIEDQANRGRAMSHVPRRYRIEFGADGSWRAPHLPSTSGELALRLPPVDGRRVLLRPTTWPELPAADLSECQRLDMQVLDATGGPANTASVLFVPGDAAAIEYAHAVALAPDQAGRLEVVLQRGEWTLLAMDATTWTHVELSQWSPDERLELRLQPKPSRRVRVLDAHGEPVAGAAFQPGNSRGVVGGRFVPVGRARPQPADGIGIGLSRLLDEMGWNGLSQHVQTVNTDSRGEATLHFLPWPGCDPEVYAWLGDTRTRSKSKRLTAGDDVIEFQLR